MPEEYAPAIARAAQRWNVSGALLAAQLYAESNFNPFASSGKALGIAQFTPATAKEACVSGNGGMQPQGSTLPGPAL